MFYYRYRPSTEISFKEFLYNEIFFSSTAEANDPFDSNTFFEFPNDPSQWKKILELVFKDFQGLNNFIDLNRLSNEISQRCPFSFKFILSNDFKKFFADILTNMQITINQNLFDNLITVLVNFFKLYSAPQSYFVSFSKSKKESLMWSHYASKHEGFCLIFKAIDGKLNQSYEMKKTSVSRNPKDSVFPISWAIPEKLQFHDVHYVPQTKPLNAFLCLPECIINKEPSKDEINQYNKDKFDQYLQKHVSWSYENESRIIMTQPIPWLCGHIEFTIQERLLYYEPTQLVGIIFGSRMTDTNKQRLRDIIKERQIRIMKSSYNRTIFNFVVFQAKLSFVSREVIIEPIEIYDLARSYNKDDKEFRQFYKNWFLGKGLCIDGNSYSSVQIK